MQILPRGRVGSWYINADSILNVDIRHFASVLDDRTPRDLSINLFNNIREPVSLPRLVPAKYNQHVPR